MRTTKQHNQPNKHANNKHANKHVIKLNVYEIEQRAQPTRASAYDAASSELVGA